MNSPRLLPNERNNVSCLYIIFFNLKKKEMKHLYMLQHEVWRHHAKSKKSAAKDHTLCDMSRIDKSMETRLPWAGGEKGTRPKTYRVDFGSDKNVLKLTVVLAAQMCEYTNGHSNVHFKCVNCT